MLSNEEKDPAVNIDARAYENSVKSVVITIDDYARLGVTTILLTGVTFGLGAVVRADSVISRHVPPMAIVARNPAPLVGHREAEPIYAL